MTHRFNRAVLLLAALAATTIYSSCKDNEDNNVAISHYLVSTNQIINKYFKPKKLNINTEDKIIHIEWLHNENAWSGSLDDYSIKNDYNQEYAEHYYFLDEKGIQKYLTVKKRAEEEVFIDENDIINPYKGYAIFYGDTVHKTRHSSLYEGELNACVLPITGIDVISLNDYDDKHPKGSSVNDIMEIDTYHNVYGYLHETDNNGIPRYKTQDEFGIMPYYVINKIVSLSTIPDNPLQMVADRINLQFISEPAAPGTYEFTVKFTFGPDPLSGETVDIAPAKVSIDF